jgi:putative ABC transport system permease protein
VLRISFQTLRANRRTLMGAFVALWLAVTLAYGTGLLMDGSLSAPGPGRFAAADFVVRADPSIATADGESEDVIPGPLLDAALVDRFDGGVGDISFPVGAWDTTGRAINSSRLSAHGWASAVLTPYRLIAGRAPSGPREVVADERLHAGDRVRVASPAGEATYRVVGTVHGPAGPASLFFADTVASRLSGAPGKVNAIAVNGMRPTLPGGMTLEVLDRSHAADADADADAGDARAADRATLVAIFGTMGGIAGMVALFVVAGTFTLAIVQRRREVAVLRALGAAPHQVRRLIAGEALIVSIVAGALGILAGRPLANAIVSVLANHDAVPAGFGPGQSWIPLAAAFGGGILVAQVAVFAAARRAGRTRPAEALRDAAIEHARPGAPQLVSGLLCLAGGVAMALIFKGTWAVAFAILEGMLLAAGVGLLGRALIGLPAALLAWPLRRLGASGLLASTSLAANRWRTAALATPIVLVAMLAGTQGIVQTSSQSETENVTAARVTAPFVVTGRDGAPLPESTAGTLAKLPGVDGIAAERGSEIYPEGSALGEDAPWPAAGLTIHGAAALDLRFSAGGLRDIRGDRVAVSHVFAQTGHLKIGDAFAARLADRTRHTLRVGAIYDRAAGLGDVVMEDAPASASAIFVAGSRRALDRFAAERDGLQVLTRDEYKHAVHAHGQEQSWGVWMIIGLATLFAGLALINTAAMATSERRGELATIRLLGGTPGQATRTVALELVPTVLVALAAGAAVVAISVHGLPAGLTGVPLSIPAPLVAAIAAGATALAILTGLASLKRT